MTALFSTCAMPPAIRALPRNYSIPPPANKRFKKTAKSSSASATSKTASRPKPQTPWPQPPPRRKNAVSSTTGANTSRYSRRSWAKASSRRFLSKRLSRSSAGNTSSSLGKSSRTKKKPRNSRLMLKRSSSRSQSPNTPSAPFRHSTLQPVQKSPSSSTRAAQARTKTSSKSRPHVSRTLKELALRSATTSLRQMQIQQAFSPPPQARTFSATSSVHSQ